MQTVEDLAKWIENRLTALTMNSDDTFTLFFIDSDGFDSKVTSHSFLDCVKKAQAIIDQNKN